MRFLRGVTRQSVAGAIARVRVAALNVCSARRVAQVRRYVAVVRGVAVTLGRKVQVPVLVQQVRRLHLPKSRAGIFLLLMLLSIFLRLPFFFTSTDGYMRDGAMTFHDEAMFMQQGHEILRGHLPFLEHWDNAPPLQWYFFGLVMLLSGGTLTGFRIMAALYVGVTAYVVFRSMADRQKVVCAWWSAAFFLIYACTFQVAQSFTIEHLLALPFSLLVYTALNPPMPSAKLWKKDVQVLGLFGFCSWISPYFLGMVPALVLLYPRLYAPERLEVLHKRKWVRVALDILANDVVPVLVRACMYLSVAAAGYAFFYVIYLLHGEGHYYLVSVLDSAGYLTGLRMDSPFTFLRLYFNKMMNSSQWLVALFTACFLIKAAMMGIQHRLRRDTLVYPMLILAINAMFMLYWRGNNGALFLFYFLQVLPLFALIMGYTINFNLADLRWFTMLVSLVGIQQTLTPVQKAYPKLIAYALGDNSQSAAYYGDRLYHTAAVMATFPLEGEDLVICGEDDMLFLLTGMHNPRFFFFPFHSTNWGLHKIIDRSFATLRNTVVDKKPLYIIGRELDSTTNRGFSEIGDLLQQRYVQVANIDGTLIYLRKDKLKNIFTN